jgi:hypothetical protein
MRPVPPRAACRDSVRAIPAGGRWPAAGGDHTSRHDRCDTRVRNAQGREALREAITDEPTENTSVRTIRDTRGSELRVARSADGHALTVQATLSTTRILDRGGVRALLDIIASSPEFRREMHNALAVYDADLSHPSRLRAAAPRPRPR